jgi:hypothetical protein
VVLEEVEILWLEGCVWEVVVCEGCKEVACRFADVVVVVDVVCLEL